jgi:hypothetical protein
MIILYDEKIIFIHIPKCGGTSISHSLDFDARWNDLFIGGTEYGESDEILIWSRRYGLRKHSTASEIKKALGDDAYQAFMKIAVVRNPIDRFVSAYNFLLYKISSKIIWAKPDIERYGLQKYPIDINHFIRSDFIHDYVFNPQEWKTTRFDGVLEDRAPDLIKSFMPQCNFLDFDEMAHSRFKLLKLEDLINEPALLSETLFSRNISLAKKNVTPKNIFLASDLSKSSYEILMELYCDDFKKLNYFTRSH